jgi:hypothetical protein
MRDLSGILHHGAEFPLIERFSAAPGYAQLEKNVPQGIKRYAKSDQRENRRQNKEAEQR